MNDRKLYERRETTRYAFSAPFTGQELSHIGAPQNSQKFEGEILDISANGVKLMADRRVEESALIRGELLLPNIPVGVPSLLQVRWIRPAETAGQYQIGLKFLV